MAGRRQMFIPFLPADHPDQLQEGENGLDYLYRITHLWPLLVQVRDEVIYVVPDKFLDEVHLEALVRDEGHFLQ